MSEQRNLILAILASIAILSAFHFLYEGPRADRMRQLAAEEQSENAGRQIVGRDDTPSADISAVGHAPVAARADVWRIRRASGWITRASMAACR